MTDGLEIGDPPDARDVVFTFSTETMRDARASRMTRPPHRLLQTLMASDEVRRLVAVDAFRSVASHLKHALPGRDPGGPRPAVHTISPLMLGRREPRRARSLERAYRRYEQAIRRDRVVATMDEPIVITCNPFVAAHCDMAWASDVVYFARDDWAHHLLRRPWWPRYEESYARIRQRGRTVFAVTRHLLDRVGAGAGTVIPNGIDPSEWVVLGPPPRWFTNLPEPRILYSGSLDGRLDVEALLAISATWSQGTLVLLGSLADREHVAPVLARPNVVHRHIHDRAEYAALVGAADVCVMPHHDNLLTRSMSPMKLYEYIAGGQRIAATDLATTREFGSRLVPAQPGRAFVDALEVALSRPRPDEGERLRYIADNSWSSRYEALLRAVLHGGAEPAPRVATNEGSGR